MKLLLTTLALLAAARLAAQSCRPVTGERILARDLAASNAAFARLDPDEAIVLAPAPGLRRDLAVAELARMAARKGIPAENLQPVCFAWPQAPLSEEQVTAAIRKSLPADGLKLEVLDFPRMPVPPGELEFQRGGLSYPPPGLPRTPVVWRGRLKYTAHRSVLVWAKIRALRSVARTVAAEDLPLGKAIAWEQLRTETREEFAVSRTTALTPESVAGKLLSRSVKAGEVILDTWLTVPNDVSKGDTISVEVKRGGAHLKFEAVAESGGRAGARIIVRNPQNGKRFPAQVTGKGAAQVAGPPEEEEQNEKTMARSTHPGSAAMPR